MIHATTTLTLTGIGSGYSVHVGPPRVFISYSHDSDKHRRKVLELANQLRTHGVDAWIDRFSPPPIEGWQLWMERQVEEAQWIILVCTETYRRRFDQREEPGKGRGVTWEGRLVRGELYNTNAGHRFIPVTFSSDDAKYIPSPLAASTSYCLDQSGSYALLGRHLRGEPEITPPPVGEPASSPKEDPLVPPLLVQSSGARIESPPESTTPVKKTWKATKRVLIVAANREDDVRLALGREVREIAAALRGTSPLRFDVHILWAATERDFRRGFLEVNPHILHFCGHGTHAGPVLEQTEYGSEVIAGKVLQSWLQNALEDNQLEIAVLNFCETRKMLYALRKTAPIVIGPTRKIVDEHAIAFSSVFYTALATGGSGSLAYHLGKSAVEMTPADTGNTRDVIEAAPPLAHPDQYGIHCDSDSELPVLGGLDPSSRSRTFAFFASEPEELPRQYLDQQLRIILEQRPSKKDRIEQRPSTRDRIEQRWATRPVDFVHTLMTARPTIVHVAGFGTPDGAFRFEHDRYAQGVAAKPPALARALAAFHQHIKCAVLMFDHSYHIAHKLDDILDCVIAVDGMASRAAVLKFSELFYQMVWHGRSYERAFETAHKALKESSDEMAPFALLGCRVERKVRPRIRYRASWPDESFSR